MIKVSFADVQQAEKRLNPFITQTSLSRSDYFSKKFSTQVFLKWETDQNIKSFKIRGALNKILSLTEEEKARGLIAASAGNHAQGVALAGRLLNIKPRVVMMETASKVKISATKKLGAEVILKGKNYDESYNHAQSIKGDSIFIHPFADSEIIAGQGTVGLEIARDLPEVDSVIVSVGGGGLLLGSALAIKALKPSVKVYGVVWEGTADFCRNFNNIRIKEKCLCQKDIPLQDSKSGLTDGIAVKKSFPEMVKNASQYVTAVVCVSEEDISKQIIELKKAEKKQAEGSGVAGLAGLLKYYKKWDIGKNCCVVISGANIDEEVLSQLEKVYS
ncbi:MAG: threonine/serine dehydratase [Bdellovibrionaceae bacterium]|nr:threonine/serine dehydratase [Pseudobdellovibrionaceae bacterium]